MRQDDEDRFADFLRGHRASLFPAAYLVTGHYQRDEDLLQSTLLRLYQRWARVVEMEHPGGYAYKVLVSQAGSWWRKRSSRETVLVLHDLPAPGDRSDDIAEHERVW